MIVHPVHGDLFLWQVSEWAQLRGTHGDVVDQALAWMETFVCRPNGDLGRSGNVCPFVRGAMTTHQSFYVGIFEATEDIRSKLASVILAYRSWFPLLSPRGQPGEEFKCLVLILRIPQPWDEVMREVHSVLKPEFVAHGLMLGEFYPGCGSPGLHNSDFRPLDAPVPFFVVRKMQPTDLPFLARNEGFLRAYRDTFGLAGRADLDRLLAKAPIRLPLDWDRCVTRLFGLADPAIRGEGERTGVE